MQTRISRLAASVLLLIAHALTSQGQTITSSIVGSVADPSGLAVVNADVLLVHTATGATRTMKSDEQGDFLFLSLQPGAYDLTITAVGFKTLQQRQIVLSSAEARPVGKLELEVGGVADKITVTAEGATVQVASSERSSVIATSQLENLMTKSRNAMSLMSLMPGVVDGQAIGNQDFMDRNFDLYVQGNRRSSNSVSLDGMVTNPMGNNFNSAVTVSQDAIAEVKALLTNYPAEYGRSSGASINLITKSGTKDFHGLGSYFKRHEQFNANSFFNNRLNAPKSRYRYNTWNYNIGGPVVLPGGLNKNRDKLFFFWSQEFWPLKSTTAITQLTVPTELERQGNFSQSLDLNGRLIPVIDPSTNAAFPGNVIPSNRLDPSGLALLQVFPNANFSERSISAGRYNYVFQADRETPVRMENLRLDYNISSRHSLSFTLASFLDRQTGGLGVATAVANWAQMVKRYRLHGYGHMLRYTGVLSPTLILETSLGFTRRPEGADATDEEIERNTRAAAGYVAGQLNPGSNPLGLIPNATFGGVTNAANLSLEGRFPFYQSLFAFNLTTNITKTLGSHILKTGIMIERNYQGTNGNGNYAGSVNFAPDVNSPLNTGYAYSNAAMGAYTTYTEASNRVFLHFRQHAVEWFVQDSWRATRRLTLDLGLRFHYLVPLYMANNTLTSFAPELYDPAKRVFLIQPALIDKQRVGVHPRTGATYPAALIGAIAPGVGDPVNGMAVATVNGYPRSLVDTYGLRLGPRLGFAYDVFGTGKTAVRGGFGMFYNRPNMTDNYSSLFVSQSPIVSNPTLYYSNFSSLLSSAGFQFPQSVNGLDRSDKVPNVMNFSMSVQQDIGFKTVVDVGYVGSLGRNLLWRRNLNPIPIGANFQPANGDPTVPGRPLPAAFLRPLPGYNDVLMSEPASSSNYHSLQVTLRRRFSHGLQFGGSWTWSKALDFADFDTDVVSSQVPVRVWNYGLASFDRTHVFKLDWVYNVPKLPVQNVVARYALHDWQLSGITSFISGSPLGIGYTTTNSADITGTATQGSRIVVLSNPVMPKGERTFEQNFRPDVFALPAVGTVGNAGRTLVRGPGINNWDISVFKDFPIREAMKLQFRAEAYNAFNHTQFSSIDTTARFDATGKQVNTALGSFTAARSPRIMQLALRFYF